MEQTQGEKDLQDLESGDLCCVCTRPILVQINKGSGICSEGCRKRAELIPGSDHKYQWKGKKPHGEQSTVSSKTQRGKNSRSSSQNSQKVSQKHR